MTSFYLTGCDSNGAAENIRTDCSLNDWEVCTQYKYTANNPYLHDEISEWVLHALAWDMSGVGDRPSLLEISMEDAKSLADELNSNDGPAMRSKALITCFGVFEYMEDIFELKGLDYKEKSEMCEAAITEAAEADDKTSNIILDTLLGNSDDWQTKMEPTLIAAQQGNAIAGLITVSYTHLTLPTTPYV